jgi:hypothetical protein
MRALPRSSGRHLRLPFLNHWNAYCVKATGAKSGKDNGWAEAMKIYLMMLLIGAIATISHVDLRHESSERKA